MAANEERITMSTCERRPCIVKGRRAIFHRWTDSARPAKPRGMEDSEDTQRFQIWSVHGLVEYEDGTMARVWPSEVQFVDGGCFAEFDWPQDDQDLPYTLADGPETYNPAKKPVQQDQKRLGYSKRRFECPTCGGYLAVYTYGPEWTENGLPEAERLDCTKCGQIIDWTGVPLPGEHQQGAAPIEHDVNDPCKGCAHEHDNEEFCKSMNFECDNCTVMGCVCKNCQGQNREPKGGAV